MEERRTERHTRHSLALESREKLNLSGVVHVESFNDETVILETAGGVLTVKGQALDVKKLNLEDGNVMIRGKINSLIYSDREGFGAKGSSFFGKMFK
ncbi:sporulation protein YabP [Serpentinicella sp. ANB-PHB4]|uniref:sporulation protein YabP n=1 Tax=Serpentinicella sp. ANB-PHB4 TaxID=3074076 RepID=UPI002856ADE0|nr:sporulation protein YabP [Serpentinicella sp. ANB-PHB4]MDR5659179.1 sporulation protein YabP [Serpentinicella sp. ANB-PHB4]